MKVDDKYSGLETPNPHDLSFHVDSKHGEVSGNEPNSTHVPLIIREKQETNSDPNAIQNEEARNSECDNEGTQTSDCGWGWIIVLGCVLLRIIIGGIGRSAPLFYVKFLDKFGGTAAQTAWVTSLGATIRLLVGPVVSVLCNRFSCRRLVFVGAVLYVVAVHITGYATSLTFLYISYGVLGGLGRSFLLTPCTILLSLYFNKNASLAFGLASSGFGLGGFIATPIIEVLFQSYGFYGTFVLLSGIACHLFICVTLFKSTKKQNVVDDGYSGLERSTTFLSNSDLGENLPINDDNNSHLTYRMCSSGSLYLSYPHAPESEPIREKSEQNTLFDRTLRKVKRYVGVSHTDGQKNKWISFSILKDVRFLTLCFATFLFSVPSSGVFLAALAGERGLTDIESAYLLSITAGCDTVIRVISGFVLDLKSIRPFRPLVYNITSFLQAITFFLIPLSRTFLHFAILCGLRGVFNGLKAAQRSVVLLDILGVENLPSSFAYLLTVQGLGTLVGPPVSGFLKDHYGKYDYAFYFGGAAVLLGSLVLAFGNLRNCLQRKSGPSGDLTN